jgi:beta-1,4-mannosyltransferase
MRYVCWWKSEVSLLSLFAFSKGEDLVPPLQAQRTKLELSLFKPFEFPALKSLCWSLFAVIKGCALVFQLSIALMTCSRADIIIVQNPPSLPTLPVVLFVGFFRRSKVVVDWHNLGWTVLTLALGPRSKGRLGKTIIWICRAVESWFSCRANAHLCVTAAMQTFLAENVGVQAVVLHDRPPTLFRNTTTVQERHDLFMRLRDK